MFQLKTVLLATSLLVVSAQAAAEGEHSHDFPKEIMAFHHVMAPLWHMVDGEERTKLSCEATDKMLSLTKAINNSSELKAAVTDMKKVCSTDKPNIQTAFAVVHDAFHAVSGEKK